MLKHYLKTAIRNILKDKVYAIINIIGLAIGLACSFFMLIYVLNELNYDQVHEKHSRIFRVHHDISLLDFKTDQTPLELGPSLKEEYPEVENYVRIHIYPKIKVKQGIDYVKEESIYLVDSSFFNVFTFPLIVGDKAHLLTEPNSVVISEKIAKKYFENENPVGKPLSLKGFAGNFELKISGVMKDISKQSTVWADFICNFDMLDNSKAGGKNSNQWEQDFYVTYLLLKENAKIADLKMKMPDFEKRHSPQNKSYKFTFQPLMDSYLLSEEFVNYRFPRGDYKSVKLFGFIGLLILFIAGINYIILSTARTARRTKEIGLRKVFGANKVMLVRQVLSESVLVTFIALPLAIFFVKIFLPIVSKLFYTELKFTLSDCGNYLLYFTLITLFIGLFSGSYLSIYLTRFQPIAILRNKVMSVNHRNYFRKAIVVVQLVIFIVLSICTTVIYRQLHYIHTKDLGFNKENLLIINCDDFGGKYISFKNEIKTNTNIENICGAQFLPPAYNFMSFECPKAYDANQKVTIEGLAVDFDFVKTFQIKIVKGMDFPKNYKYNIQSDTNKLLLSNESTIKELGIKNPINYKISQFSAIIGVVKDFNFHSLHSKIPPLIIGPLINIDYVSQIAVRIRPENKTETIKYLEKKWKEFSKEPFDYYFIDDRLDDMLKKENKQAKILRIFSFFAIFIAMLGLFGLSLFTSQQRTKEIGIRKVHGASITDIMRLLSKEYITLVIIANILAAPIAYYFMNKWLQNFAYHINIEWWVFGLVFILSLIIVLLTVSWQAYRAAKKNPVVTLKYE
jgi:putative ABC transport system permease protein